jgi:hypothetical protein
MGPGLVAEAEDLCMMAVDCEHRESLSHQTTSFEAERRRGWDCCNYTVWWLLAVGAVEVRHVVGV